MSTSSPPSPPPTYRSGGIPSTIPDVPISAVFVVLFLSTALSHLYQFKAYKQRFKWSGACMGFCFSRVVAFSLRIVWAQHPTNSDLALASTIFILAATVLLYVIILQYTKKQVLAIFRLSPKTRQIIKALFEWPCYILPPVIICLVVGAVVSSLSSNAGARGSGLSIVKFGQVTQMVFCAAPLGIIPLIFVLSFSRGEKLADDKAGKRHVSFKELHLNLAILFCMSAILLLESAIRVSGTFPTTVRTTKLWYFSKAAFYCFQPVIEWSVVTSFSVLVAPHRFGRLDRQVEVDEVDPQADSLACLSPLKEAV